MNRAAQQYAEAERQTWRALACGSAGLHTSWKVRSTPELWERIVCLVADDARCADVAGERSDVCLREEGHDGPHGHDMEAEHIFVMDLSAGVSL